MNNWVYAGFNETYKKLGVTFDKNYYESETYLLGKDLIEDGLKSNVFYKKEDNEFKLIDWKRIFDEEYGFGIDFNSRFPPLNISNSSQLLSGKLRYGMVSYGFEMILKNDIFKLRIYIKDRELNTSNIIETPEVTLEEILSE